MNKFTIKLNNQPYEFQIIRNSDIINIMVTNTDTKMAYACGLDEQQTRTITLEGGLIRNIDKFYKFLIIGLENNNSHIGHA